MFRYGTPLLWAPVHTDGQALPTCSWAGTHASGEKTVNIVQVPSKGDGRQDRRKASNAAMRHWKRCGGTATDWVPRGHLYTSLAVLSLCLMGGLGTCLAPTLLRARNLFGTYPPSREMWNARGSIRLMYSVVMMAQCTVGLAQRPMSAECYCWQRQH